MKEKIKKVLVLTLIAFLCSLAIYLVVRLTGGNV